MKGTLYFNTYNGRYYLDTGKCWMKTHFDGSWILSWHAGGWITSKYFKRIGNNYRAKN